jgi:hypothetical protein
MPKNDSYGSAVDDMDLEDAFLGDLYAPDHHEKIHGTNHEQAIANDGRSLCQLHQERGIPGKHILVEPAAKQVAHEQHNNGHSVLLDDCQGVDGFCNQNLMFLRLLSGLIFLQ